MSKLLGILSTAFVKLRVLQILMVCAVLLVFIRLERLYNISNDMFVNSANAETPKDPVKEEKPAENTPKKEEEKPAEKKEEFAKDNKPQEGFKAESFNILELSAEQVEVLRTLSKRHGDLVERERSISEREATLQAIEKRLDTKTEELKKIQEYLKELLGEKEEKEKEAIKKLVLVYQKMKPAEAANILQELDLETLLNIMDEMKETSVSAILAKMEPVRARFLTMELAQRRKKLEERMKSEHESDAELAKLTPASVPEQPKEEKPNPKVENPVETLNTSPKPATVVNEQNSVVAVEKETTPMPKQVKPEKNNKMEIQKPTAPAKPEVNQNNNKK